MPREQSSQPIRQFASGLKTGGRNAVALVAAAIIGIVVITAVYWFMLGIPSLIIDPYFENSVSPGGYKVIAMEELLFVVIWNVLITYPVYRGLKAVIWE